MSEEQSIHLQLQLTRQEIADCHELLAEGGIAAMAVLGLRSQQEALRVHRSAQGIRMKLSQAEVASRQSQPVPIPTTDNALVPFIRKQAA